MKKNVGSIDKVIRILIAVVVAVLYFTNIISGTLGIVLLVIGGILLLTVLIGTCPIYLTLGLSSRKKNK